MERMTTIELQGGQHCGLSEYGRKPVPEMIVLFRRHAEQMKREAEEILAAEDSDFFVHTHKGVYVHKDCEVLQRGRRESGR